MLHLVTLCLSLASFDIPTQTECTTIITTETTDAVARAYVSEHEPEWRSFDTVWHETSGNVAHVVYNMGDADEDDVARAE